MTFKILIWWNLTHFNVSKTLITSIISIRPVHGYLQDTLKACIGINQAVDFLTTRSWNPDKNVIQSALQPVGKVYC